MGPGCKSVFLDSVHMVSYYLPNTFKTSKSNNKRDIRQKHKIYDPSVTHEGQGARFESDCFLDPMNMVS